MIAHALSIPDVFVGLSSLIFSAAEVVAKSSAQAAPSLTVTSFLILVAGILLIGVLGEIVFDKTGIPDVVWLILVGIFIGPISGLASRQILSEIAPFFGALTLIVVLFNGGSELRISELKQAAARATGLALSTFFFSMISLATLSMGAKQVGLLPSEWSWMHGLCLGSILGGSSSIVVMPALKKARLNARLSNLTNLESALTDSFCVVGVGAAIQIMLSGSGSAGRSAITALGKSFGIGIAAGAMAGILGVLLLRRLAKSEHAYPLTLGALIFLYVIVDNLGGSAALAILTTAIILGNAKVFSRHIGLNHDAVLDQGIRDVHGQITFFIKSFFFTFIGAMLSGTWSLIALGIIIGICLLLVRIPAVFLATARSGLDQDSKKIAAIFLPRGMAAGVLAMMPHSMGVPGTADLPVLVFAAIVTTIVLFSAGFPILKHRIGKREKAAKDEALQNAASTAASAIESALGNASLFTAPTPSPDSEEKAAAHEGLADVTSISTPLMTTSASAESTGEAPANDSSLPTPQAKDATTTSSDAPDDVSDMPTAAI